MIPNRHGGGPAGSVVVDDTGQILIQPFDKLRTYLEIQNNDGLNGQPAARIHIQIYDTAAPAEYGKGLFLNPGGIYCLDTTNLSPAAIKAVTATGLQSVVYFQVGH